MTMKMRVLHLESEPRHSQVIDEIFRTRLEDVSFTHVAAAAMYRETIEMSSPFDLVIIGARNVGLLAETQLVSAVPIICLAPTEKERRRIQTSSSVLWSVVTQSDTEGLVLAASRAIAFSRLKRSHETIESELSQAKDLLLKCQKSITIGRLLGSIAHEINNPLEAMSNLVYLAQRNTDDPESLRQTLELVERELQQVGEITKQMLTFHRDSKDVQMVRVTEVMEGVLSLHEARIRNHRIDVIRQYRDVGVLSIYPGELRQIISNLISNAIEALEDGGHLILRVQERRGAKPRLCITVADTGVGMSREQSKKVGELFYTTKGEGGTGLGMWVSRQLVSKHDGTLHVYSSKRPGHSGTAFHLCFQEPQAIFQADDSDGATTLNPRSNRGQPEATVDKYVADNRKQA